MANYLLLLKDIEARLFDFWTLVCVATEQHCLMLEGV